MLMLIMPPLTCCTRRQELRPARLFPFTTGRPRANSTGKQLVVARPNMNMNMKFHAPFLSSVLALLLSSAAATDIAEVVAAQHIAKIFNARCAAAGGHGTKTGMIPWVGKLGGTSSRYVFNIGPENDCNIGLTESELWTSNLTDAGTFRIKGAPPTVSGEQPAVLTAVHKLLYVAGDDASGEELWVSDGTAEGTMLLKDVRSGPEGSGTSMLMACGTLVYFGADDGVHGRELWASDGTAADGVLLRPDCSAQHQTFRPLQRPSRQAHGFQWSWRGRPWQR